MVTLDLDFWLMLCSQEKGALKKRVCKHVGWHQTTTHKHMVQEKLIRSFVLRRYVQQRKNVKFSNFASHFIDACPSVFKSSFVYFSFFLCLSYRLSMILTSPYDPKCPVHPLVFKSDVTLVQTLRLFIFDFFTFNLFLNVRRLYLNTKKCL